ncbi:aromatase/cyclase [Micromonospora marina]|uniref:Aromatase n=1 Tax=Micromonospora marina TaxID=307120 RepID=A0A1C4ZWH1_9ACTN|nr:aromatase/cyclase [Micromonospora marina]SCF37317.1 aromatase [Micromonospora marina]
MSGPQTYTTEHTAVVPGPPDLAYELVADVRRWPAVFGPTVYVEHLGHQGRQERFQLWALVNGEVKTWTSRRVLEPDAGRIRFEQERSQPPVASMGGEWLFRPLPDERTEVVLRHHFTGVDDDPEAVAWIRAALHRNSPAELGALTRIAELGEPIEDVVFSFEDTVEIPGAVSDAYEFVDRADRWAERLPHVRRAALTEEVPGVQTLEMETVTAEGAAHTTRSVRVCRAPELVAYKQLVPPKLLLGHSGTWSFTERSGNAVVTARHTVAMNPHAVAETLAAGTSLADARAYVRSALGGNSGVTLARAGEFAAARRAGRTAGASAR